MYTFAFFSLLACFLPLLFPSLFRPFLLENNFILSRNTGLQAYCFQTTRTNLISLRMESASYNEFMSVSLLPNGSKVTSQASVNEIVLCKGIW